MDQKNGWTNYKLDLPGMRGGNSGRCDSGSEGLLATRSGKGKAQGDNTILQTITIQTGLPGVRNSLYVQVTTDVDLPCSFPHRWTAIKAPTAKDAHLAKAKVWGIQWLMVYGIPEEGSNSLSHTAVFIRPKQTPPIRGISLAVGRYSRSQRLALQQVERQEALSRKSNGSEGSSTFQYLARHPARRRGQAICVEVLLKNLPENACAILAECRAVLGGYNRLRATDGSQDN